MISRKVTVFTALAAVSLLVFGSTVATAQSRRACGGDRQERENGLQVIGLTDDSRLICFASGKPEQASSIGSISGLAQADSNLVGIDYRVQDGNLYGVGSGGGIYTLDSQTAAATKVGQLTVALSGSDFGVDFNPAANALRVISDTGQNLRHPFAGPLAGQTQNDAGLNYIVNNVPAAATGVTGAAYTNNDLDPATATTLFDIDSLQDQVAIQSPPNAGTLFSTGKLTVDTAADVGFDIYSGRDGNQAFASLNVGGGRTGFYQVDLLTGRAKLQGRFTPGDVVTGIAIPLAQR